MRVTIIKEHWQPVVCLQVDTDDSSRCESGHSNIGSACCSTGQAQWIVFVCVVPWRFRHCKEKGHRGLPRLASDLAGQVEFSRSTQPLAFYFRTGTSHCATCRQKFCLQTDTGLHWFVEDSVVPCCASQPWSASELSSLSLCLMARDVIRASQAHTFLIEICV
jgi:hypothetical protein